MSKPFDKAPLPLDADEYGILHDGDGNHVGEIAHDSLAADAALGAEICRRVNLHDDLVKALRDLHGAAIARELTGRDTGKERGVALDLLMAEDKARGES